MCIWCVPYTKNVYVHFARKAKVVYLSVTISCHDGSRLCSVLPNPPFASECHKTSICAGLHLEQAQIRSMPLRMLAGNAHLSTHSV